MQANQQTSDLIVTLGTQITSTHSLTDMTIKKASPTQVHLPKTNPLHSVFLAMRSAVMDREATRMVEDPIPSKTTEPYTFSPMSGHSRNAQDPATNTRPDRGDRVKIYDLRACEFYDIYERVINELHNETGKKFESTRQRLGSLACAVITGPTLLSLLACFAAQLLGKSICLHR